MDSCIRVEENQPFVQVLINVMEAEWGRVEKRGCNSEDKVPGARLAREWTAAWSIPKSLSRRPKMLGKSFGI